MGPRSHSYSQTCQIQHIKGIGTILADSVSRLNAVGLYHDLNFLDSKKEHGTPFQPLPPVDQSTHTPIEVQENLFIPI